MVSPSICLDCNPPGFFETPHLWWICSSITAASSGCSRLIGLLPEFLQSSPSWRDGEMMAWRKKADLQHHKFLIQLWFIYTVYIIQIFLTQSQKTILLSQDNQYIGPWLRRNTPRSQTLQHRPPGTDTAGRRFTVYPPANEFRSPYPSTVSPGFRKPASKNHQFHQKVPGEFVGNIRSFWVRGNTFHSPSPYGCFKK